MWNRRFLGLYCLGVWPILNLGPVAALSAVPAVVLLEDAWLQTIRGLAYSNCPLGCCTDEIPGYCNPVNWIGYHWCEDTPCQSGSCPIQEQESDGNRTNWTCHCQN